MESEREPLGPFKGYIRVYRAYRDISEMETVARWGFIGIWASNKIRVLAVLPWALWRSGACFEVTNLRNYHAGL